jgi:hypothetical protein
MLPMLTIAEESRAPHCRLSCGRYQTTTGEADADPPDFIDFSL